LAESTESGKVLLSGFSSSELGTCGLVVDEGSSGFADSLLVAGPSLLLDAAVPNDSAFVVDESMSSDLYSPSSNLGVTTELSLSG
jgi:hypothetical protein